jgi:hypothetical protein
VASAAPPGHTDYEHVIGSALKCPHFECIEGQTDWQTHISALYYIEQDVFLIRILYKTSRV